MTEKNIIKSASNKISSHIKPFSKVVAELKQEKMISFCGVRIAD